MKTLFNYIRGNMNYQFQSNRGNFSYKSNFFSEAIKVLITVNFLIYVLQSISGPIVASDLWRLFGLVPKQIWADLMLWQPFTYLFFHDSNPWHVLMNMFVLWMFGTELERLWGRDGFIKYYFITGVGSGIITGCLSLNSMVPLIGASGAVFGIILAYGLTFPNRTIYLWGIVPIKSIVFVIFIGILSLFSTINSTSNISHLTHLAGMFIGYIYLKRKWRFKTIVFSLRKKIIEYQIQREEKKVVFKKTVENDIDILLDKINKSGFESLSAEEEMQLYENSKIISRSKKKD
tara:strand:- start:832 stop:1701 length:870 start_codon:yes stop_codon:yes gene_type:complete